MPHGTPRPPRPLRLAGLLLLACLPAACGDATPPPGRGAGAESGAPGEPAVGPGAASAASGTRTGERLVVELGCAACHVGVPGPVRPEAPPLRPRAADPAWTFAFLEAPARHGSGGGAGEGGEGRGLRMPDFPLDPAERLALAFFVAEAAGEAGRGGEAPGEKAAGGPEAAAEPARRVFRAARAGHPEVGAEEGRRLFTALNCAGCHAGLGPEPRRNGPELSREGARARRGWLAGWLRAPAAIRPYGAPPGTGGRMPDFRLTREEADSVAAFLLRAGDAGAERDEGGEEARQEEREDATGEAADAGLTAFERRKAEALLRDRLSCLGCHALDGEGGRIGPDLAGAAARRPAAWIRGMLERPGATSPGTVMPRIPLPPGTGELLEAYLLGRGAREAEAGGPAGGADGREDPRRGYLSPLRHPLLPPVPPADETGAATYLRSCAACHGAEGRADGYNARYLPVTPTPHASARHMATRTDHTLFDGIHAGGRILGRSHRMPPFGGSLGEEEVWDLVGRMRSLCGCRGPAWSRDGGEVPARVLEAGPEPPPSDAGDGPPRR